MLYELAVDTPENHKDHSVPVLPADTKVPKGAGCWGGEAELVREGNPRTELGV